MPGAGSTKGANFFQDQEYDDGTLIFGSSGSTQFPYLLGDPRVKYEYGDWNVVLASGTGGVSYLPPALAEQVAGGGASAIAGEDFIYGSQGATRLDLVRTGCVVRPRVPIESSGWPVWPRLRHVLSPV